MGVRLLSWLRSVQIRRRPGSARLMGAMEEKELFTKRFDAVDPEALWAALKRSLATMDLKDADDRAMVARFATGLSTWSWGQNNIAYVTAPDTGGSLLTVRGRPKASLLTSGFGERRHASGLEKQLLADVEALLRGA